MDELSARSLVRAPLRWAPRLAWRALVLGGTFALASAGCEGLVGEPPARPFAEPDDVAPGVVQPAPQTRLPRLTHRQYENAVRDLFGLEARLGVGETFRPDSIPGGAIFDNPGGELRVDGLLWEGYQSASREVAALVVADAALLERVDPSGDADTFIRELGARAQRRPLTDDEVTEYRTVYASAAGLYGPEVDDRTAGVRLVIEAMLQSPGFLYRHERSDEREDGTIPLDGYEVASRLSFALWNSMPDEELFEAAAADELRDPEAVAAQARRMLDDPRAEDAVVDFHRQLFGARYFNEIEPDREAFPQVSDDLPRFALEEHDRFVVEIVLGRDGTYADLLTSNDTFVNAELASIYGLEGEFGAEFEPVTLDPNRRRGVLTQVGFLAANATRLQPDPIHRGVFVAEKVAGVHIQAPPDDLPAPPVLPGATNREIVEQHTEQPGSVCAGCHTQIINPFGFAFESYDAVGAWRDTDNGHPVDTTARVPIDGVATPVAGAPDLVQTLAESLQAHEAYVAHWIEYAFGRQLKSEDQALVTALGARSASGELTVRELMVELVSSRAFLQRSTREEY
jgi:hypothetical protein